MSKLIKRYTGEEHEDHESLNYMPFYEHFGDDVEDTDYIVKNLGASYYKGHVAPVEISYMEDLIGKLKKEGATHMEVMYHSDHGSYCINGVELRLPTEDEVKVDTDLKDEINRKDLLGQKKLIEASLLRLNKELGL